MKINNYQKIQEIRYKLINEQIAQDLLTNPLLEKAQEIDNYYKDWIKDSRLVAVLPALDSDNPNAQSYYSVSSLSKDNIEKNKRLSPVFLYINDPGFEDLSLTAFSHNVNAKRFFTFDSECDNLYSYQKKPNSQDCHFVKKDGFEELKQHIIDNPVILYFQGCDDGHVGRRFKTQVEAMEYLQMIEVFEDIFSDKLEYHN
jgi:hypothetical protein